MGESNIKILYYPNENVVRIVWIFNLLEMTNVLTVSKIESITSLFFECRSIENRLLPFWFIGHTFGRKLLLSFVIVIYKS